MATSSSTFDPALDPFRATFEALLEGGQFRAGAYKCITINGQHALKFIEKGQVPLMEYWDYLWGRGDYAADKILKVIRDDTVMAGIRREFFYNGITNPEEIDSMRDYIEQGIYDIMKSIPKAEGEVKKITSHIVGESPVNRTTVTKKTDAAFHNLFETDDALQSIKRFVDEAEITEYVQEGQKWISEVFSYALPEKEAKPEIDNEISRGMKALLEKEIPLPIIWAMFESAYPKETSSVDKIKRFVLLILPCLSMSSYPIPALKDLLQIAEKQLPGAGPDFVKNAQEFLSLISQAKKKNEDACLLLLPLLMKAFSQLPEVDFNGQSDLITTFSTRYKENLTLSQHTEKKASLPGLRGFGDLLARGESVDNIFTLRPSTFRKGEEEEQAARFFHHVAEAAKESMTPSAVLKSAIPLLQRCVTAEYSPMIEDLVCALQTLNDSPVVKNDLVPFLESVVPKEGQKPEPGLTGEVARRQLTSMLLQATVHSPTPSKVLLGLFPLFKEQMKNYSPDYEVIIEEIGTLLPFITQEEDQVLVQRVLVPLIEKLIPQPGRAPEIDLTSARSLMADVIYLNRSAKVLPKIQEGFTFEQIRAAFDSAVKEALTNTKEECIEWIHTMLMPEGRSGEEKFTYHAGFMMALNRILRFDATHRNIGILPKVREIFFSGPQPVPSGDISDITSVTPRKLLDFQKQIPESLYDKILIDAKIPAEIRSW